jgi:hypothetical protein
MIREDRARVSLAMRRLNSIAIFFTREVHLSVPLLREGKPIGVVLLSTVATPVSDRQALVGKVRIEEFHTKFVRVPLQH